MAARRGDVSGGSNGPSGGALKVGAAKLSWSEDVEICVLGVIKAKPSGGSSSARVMRMGEGKRSGGRPGSRTIKLGGLGPP